jgi:hypothetical protein
MSFKIHHSKLSQELDALDNQATPDPSPLPLRPTIHLIISKKGGGKSSLLLNMLKSKNMYNKKIDNIYLFSPTALNDHKFDDLVEELDEEGHFFSKLTDENLQKTLDGVKAYNETFDKKKKKREPFNLIIFDDLLAEISRKGHKAELLSHLITTCRHYKCSLIFLIQKMKVPPLLRANADLISLFKITNTQEKKDALTEWSIPESLYDYCTSKPFSFLHISYCNGGQPLYFCKFSPIEL